MTKRELLQRLEGFSDDLPISLLIKEECDYGVPLESIAYRTGVDFEGGPSLVLISGEAFQTPEDEVDRLEYCPQCKADLIYCYCPKCKEGVL
jgi:hypothetical protein